MSEIFQSELRKYLDKDENLLWTGKPRAGIIFRLSDIFVIPFSVLWCGFAIFWVVGASKGSVVFALFGVPFVIAGLIFVFGRFIIDAKQRENITYGLTENRVLIKSGFLSRNIRSLNIKTLSDIELIEKNDGTGTILFGPKSPFSTFESSMNWWPGIDSNAQIDLIPNARKVYNQIIEIQNEN